MTNERLKEIKDSIDSQLEMAKQLNIDNELLLEEKELYDYAELLKERISYLERSIVRKEETIAELEQERVPYTNEYVDKVDKENEELKKQQQEFIKYLEDEINYIQSSIVNLPVISYERNYLANLGNDLLRVLQKYKEIIGETNDTK